MRPRRPPAGFAGSHPVFRGRARSLILRGLLSPSERGTAAKRQGVAQNLYYDRSMVAKRVIGVGKFASGKPDLGSNKGHLKNFGR
jgi:hypothetical protein